MLYSLPYFVNDLKRRLHLLIHVKSIFAGSIIYADAVYHLLPLHAMLILGFPCMRGDLQERVVMEEEGALKRHRIEG